MSTDWLNEIILKQSHSEYSSCSNTNAREGERDSHLTLEREGGESKFFLSRLDTKSNNRLNDDDRAEKRKEREIEGNTFHRGQNTEQYDEREEDNKQDTNDYQSVLRERERRKKVEYL